MKALVSFVAALAMVTLVAVSSFAVSAAEEPGVETPATDMRQSLYDEFRFRLRPEENTLRDIRKGLGKGDNAFSEESPDGGVNIVVLK